MADPDLLRQAREGSPRALGRLLSMVEEGGPALRPLLAGLSDPGTAHVVGVTGPPGAGKSTTSAALVRVWRSSGLRVAVLAVDPSSPFSGGALLGDRIRMTEHALDPEVFVRSMASRGHLGGLAAATPQAVRLLSAAGFDRVLVETVGVGQNEVEVAGTADTTLVLLAPGMGDGVQAAKAGILEVADIVAVNKADRDGAAATARDLRAALTRSATGSWSPPVLLTTATTGEGVDKLADAVAAHHDHLVTHGGLEQRRRLRAESEIAALALGMLHDRMLALPAGRGVQAQALLVQSGQQDPYAAADRVVAAVTDGLS